MKKLKRLHPDDIQFLKQEIVKDLKPILENRNLNRWVQSNEFCSILGISRTKLIDLRNKNQISYSQIGKHYYYNLDEIERLLDNNKIMAFNR